MVAHEFKKAPVYATSKSSRGFITSFLASSKVTEDEIKKYDVKAAKKFLKKHESHTEIVDTMYRCSKRYAESMSTKKYEVIAAICIVQGVEYVGCEQWNQRLATAMKRFEHTCSVKNDERAMDYDFEKIAQRKQKVIKIIEEYLDEIIVGDYQYELNSDTEDGLFELVITDQENIDAEMCFIIDPYVVHGNDIFLMDSNGTSIPFFREDIITTIINGKELSKKNLDEASEYEFKDKELYNCFDLSNCKKLKKIDISDYHKFESVLLNVKEKCHEKYDTVLRFRIEEFKESDEFCLICDKHVANNRYYSGQVIEGKIIRVKCYNNQIYIIEE